MSDVSPRKVLEQVAMAIPHDCRESVIIVGSLAAGYQLLPHDDAWPVRTKDIDCVLFPRITAVESGKAVAKRLLESGWTPRTEGDHGEPGNVSTPDDKLPVVRLYPPGSKEWFLELLTVPEPEDEGQRWTRLELEVGHYALPSFKFLSISTYEPTKTDLGLFCARPEMMALANLLEHPEIKPDLMSGLIESRRMKRSNKDLGRVLAIARLSPEDAIETWPDPWEESLRKCFPAEWRKLVQSIGAGLRQLLASEDDLEEAAITAQSSLLAFTPTTPEELMFIGRRLIKDAIEPLEELGRRSAKRQPPPLISKDQV